MFKTIEKNETAEITEKKSKFICNIFYVETEEEAESIIKSMEKKYFDARHNCYAYSIFTENGILNRFSDNGEPSGTAGGPILNIINSQGISNVLVVVTRYFGGILLGTGGLVKAYSQATTEALNKTNFVQKDLGIESEIIVNYQDLEKLKYYFKQKNVLINDISYEENAIVNFDILEAVFDNMIKEKENLNFNILSYKKIKNKFINIIN